MLAVKTRSKTIDYTDFGNNPYTDWEKEWGIRIGKDPMVDPAKETPAADICLLVDKGQWKGALYWLYGNRKDKDNRSIRYGIVGGGQLGDGDAAIFYRLCAHALGGREQQDELARLLDPHFDDAVIQELHDKQKSSKEEAYQQVRGILSQVADQLPEPAATAPLGEDLTGSLRCELVTADNTKKIRQYMQLLVCQKELEHPILLFHGVTGARVDTAVLGGRVAGYLVCDDWKEPRPREPIPVASPARSELEPTKAKADASGTASEPPETPPLAEPQCEESKSGRVMAQIQAIKNTIEERLNPDNIARKVVVELLERKTLETVLQQVKELEESIRALLEPRGSGCPSSPTNRDIFM